MTRNTIKRSHDNPDWSGRLVEGSNRGWDYDEQNLRHLSCHLKDALMLAGMLHYEEYLSPEFEQHGVVPMHMRHKLANLFTVVSDLQRYLPWIEAWCVVEFYPDGSRNVEWSFDTEEQAREWCARVRQRSHIRANPWTVEYTAAPILTFMHPEAKIEKFLGA